MEHELKCDIPYFDAVKDGRKTFELRYNDRGYQAGDLVTLRRWNPETKTYANGALIKRISYVLAGDGDRGLEEGWAILALADV